MSLFDNSVTGIPLCPICQIILLLWIHRSVKSLSLLVTLVLNFKGYFNVVTTRILVSRSMLHVPINCGPSFCSAKLYLHLHSWHLNISYKPREIDVDMALYHTHSPSEINVWSTKLSHKALLLIINVLTQNLFSLACGFETGGKKIATH